MILTRILVLSSFCTLAYLFLGKPLESDVDAKGLDILVDFVFVGSGPCKFRENGSVETAEIVSHGESELPRPKKLEKGVQYVFHHRGHLDNESLALRELPAKLSAMGYKVLKAPQSNKELVHLFMGGPLFYIEFSDAQGKHKAAIFNQPDTRVVDGSQMMEDYVLVYLH